MHPRDKIARWMKETGLSQEEVAEAIGMYGQSNVSQYIRGKIQTPGLPWMIAVARAMNCSLEWLIDEAADYPMVPRVSSAATLTDYERRALALIHEVDGAVGPGTAIRRLLRADVAGEVRPAHGGAVADSSPIVAPQPAQPPKRRRASGDNN